MNLSLEYRSRPLPGERANGDAVLVRREGARTLFAVIDGLGHGEGAAKCSAAATAWLQGLDLAAGAPSDWMLGLHAALHGERGAAALLCRVENGRLHGVSVGNIAMRGFGFHLPYLTSGGIVGRGRLRLLSFEAQLVPGARLAAFSDGISSSVDLEPLLRQHPAAACEAILERFGKQTDDATVLVGSVEN